jgi:hypothetical protein
MPSQRSAIKAKSVFPSDRGSYWLAARLVTSEIRISVTISTTVSIPIESSSFFFSLMAAAAAATSPFITFFLERLIGEGLCRHGVHSDNIVPSIGSICNKYHIFVTPNQRELILKAWDAGMDEHHAPSVCVEQMRLEGAVNRFMLCCPRDYDDAFDVLREHYSYYMEDEDFTEEQEEEAARVAHAAYEKYKSNHLWNNSSYFRQ